MKVQCNKTIRLLLGCYLVTLTLLPIYSPLKGKLINTLLLSYYLLIRSFPFQPITRCITTTRRTVDHRDTLTPQLARFTIPTPPMAHRKEVKCYSNTLNHLPFSSESASRTAPITSPHLLISIRPRSNSSQLQLLLNNYQLCARPLTQETFLVLFSTSWNEVIFKVPFTSSSKFESYKIFDLLNHL